MKKPRHSIFREAWGAGAALAVACLLSLPLAGADSPAAAPNAEIAQLYEALKELQDSVRAQDQPRFNAADKTMLTSCYACHVAAEKPYLRLHVPAVPAETMIEFDPAKPGSPTP